MSTSDFSVDGDPLSKLLQAHARRAGLHKIGWTGKGVQDIELLCCDCSNKTLLSQSLWNGFKEIWDLPELKKLGENKETEPLYAKICSCILKAQAIFDLRLEARNERAKKIPVPNAPQVPA
jgi:hypothetical protein